MTISSVFPDATVHNNQVKMEGKIGKEVQCEHVREFGTCTSAPMQLCGQLMGSFAWSIGRKVFNRAFASVSPTLSEQTNVRCVVVLVDGPSNIMRTFTCALLLLLSTINMSSAAGSNFRKRSRRAIAGGRVLKNGERHPASVLLFFMSADGKKRKSPGLTSQDQSFNLFLFLCYKGVQAAEGAPLPADDRFCCLKSHLHLCDSSWSTRIYT